MNATTSRLRAGASIVAIVAAALSLPLAAHAQDAAAGVPVTPPPGPAAAGSAAAGSAATGQAETLEEIVVTGTAIRGVAPVGSATVNITQEAIIQSGIRDP